MHRVDKVHAVPGEGNFVLVGNERLFDDKLSTRYDFYRVQDDLIIEHWDVIESIRPRTDWKNNNGKF